MRHLLLAMLCIATALPAVAAAQYATVGGVTIRAISHQALVRSALGDLIAPERRVSQLGMELTLPSPWRALRVEGRLLGAEGGRVDLRSLDAGLVVGWRTLGVAAAFGQRGSYDPASGLAHARDAQFGRAGLRLRLGDPDAPFILHLRGDTYVPLRAVNDAADALDGWDAEGGVTWRAKELPYTVSLGYRLERFRIFRVEQEVSALTVALGAAFGGR